MNEIFKDKYSVKINIWDFSSLPRFIIDTPTFKFDSHLTPKFYDLDLTWVLRVRQTLYQGEVKKTICYLDYNDKGHKTQIFIRLPKDSVKHFLKIEDFIEIFQQDFSIETINKMILMPKGSSLSDSIEAINKIAGSFQKSSESTQISKNTLDTSCCSSPQEGPYMHASDDQELLGAYSDEELLAEINRRTKVRLGDFRGKPKQPVDLSNVLDIDKYRQKPFDESKLEKILAA